MAGFHSSSLLLEQAAPPAILCFLSPESSQPVVLLCPRGRVAISGGILVVMPKGGGVLLAPSGCRTGMLPSIQQCTEQNPAPRRAIRAKVEGHGKKVVVGSSKWLLFSVLPASPCC